MKYKFLIFNVHNNDGLISMYPVMVRADKETYLQFDTYDAAEHWIQEQRENGETHIYQIQKLYVS